MISAATICNPTIQWYRNCCGGVCAPCAFGNSRTILQKIRAKLFAAGYTRGMNSTTHATTSSTLPPVLGPWMPTAIVIGTVIGSGVFKKPFDVAKNVEHFGLAISGWILIGLVALMGALTLAEVAIILPRAGGNYVFLREGYGRLAGFLLGWVDFWMIRSGSIAALASVFSESVHDVIRQARDLPTGDRVFGFWTQQALTVA